MLMKNSLTSLLNIMMIGSNKLISKKKLLLKVNLLTRDLCTQDSRDAYSDMKNIHEDGLNVLKTLRKLEWTRKNPKHQLKRNQSKELSQLLEREDKKLLVMISVP